MKAVRLHGTFIQNKQKVEKILFMKPKKKVNLFWETLAEILQEDEASRILDTWGNFL